MNIGFCEDVTEGSARVWWPRTLSRKATKTELTWFASTSPLDAIKATLILARQHLVEHIVAVLVDVRKATRRAVSGRSVQTT